MYGIFSAIKCGNFEGVKHMVNEDPKYIHIQDTTKRTPLDRAIALGKLEIAQFLYEKGGRPNPDIYRDRERETPVHDATERKYTDTLKWVFTKKVLPLHVLNIKGAWKMTPFDVAIVHGDLEIAQFFFEKGGRPNLDIYRDGVYTPVHEIAQDGHTKTLEWVFKEEVLPMRRVLNIKDDNGWTPLDCAIAHGNLEIAQYLWGIDGQPNLEMYCNEKITPVHHAALYGHNAVLEWFFTKGILPLRVLNVKYECGWAPLDFAIHRHNIQTAALLRRLPINAAFLALHHAKRDYYQCVLRRLPDELLDMVVDEVAARFHLKIIW